MSLGGFIGRIPMKMIGTDSIRIEHPFRYIRWSDMDGSISGSSIKYTVFTVGENSEEPNSLAYAWDWKFHNKKMLIF